MFPKSNVKLYLRWQSFCNSAGCKFSVWRHSEDLLLKEDLFKPWWRCMIKFTELTIQNGTVINCRRELEKEQLQFDALLHHLTRLHTMFKSRHIFSNTSITYIQLKEISSTNLLKPYTHTQGEQISLLLFTLVGTGPWWSQWECYLWFRREC